jgi:hypothetical protein
MTTPRFALVAGLVLAAAGVLTEFLTGVKGFPKIPPGPIILGVAALLVATVRWKWTPVLGLAVALFITGGGVIATASGSFRPQAEPGPVIGTAVQALGLLIAIAAGIAAVAAAARRRPDRPAT